MKTELMVQINAFLLDQRKSEGGYALVTNQDIQDLHSIVSRLIVEKCERDPDGDLPIDFTIINRREKHFAIDPWINALPYRADEVPMPDPLEKGGRLEKLMFIVNQATSMLATELDVVQYHNELNKKSTAKWIDKVTN